MNKQIRICVEDNGVIHKITSIYLSRDGSFMMDVPYCDYDGGLVIKTAVNLDDYKKHDMLLTVTEELKAKKRPKLSIHASGFIQFSGKGTVSGVDDNGKIKGIGIFSAPLDTPISSGPTFGGSFWGLNHFLKTKSVSFEDIVIKKQDFIKRIFKHLRKDSVENTFLNTYLLEFFVFPERMSGLIKKSENREEMTLSFPQYRESPGAIFTFPVIRLMNHGSFLGVLPFYYHSDFPEQSDFGFMIGSPTGTNKPTDKNGMYIIYLLFPNNLSPEINKYIDF